MNEFQIKTIAVFNGKEYGAGLDLSHHINSKDGLNRNGLNAFLKKLNDAMLHKLQQEKIIYPFRDN